MPSNPRIYDGSTYPDEHVSRFVGAANQGEWQMPMWCRIFQQTLDVLTGDPTKVSKIIRKANETLLDFKERWIYKMSYIQDVLEVMQISAFMSNSKCPELVRRFSEQVLRTVTEMIKRVDDFIKTIYEGRRQRTNNRNDFNVHRDHYQPYVPPRANNQRYDNRRYVSNHLSLDALTKRSKEILATKLQLQIPPCPLMWQLEMVLESGKLSHSPGKEGMQGEGSRETTMVKIELEVSFENEGLCQRTMMKFIVVRASSPYSIILGPTGMQELHAICSTIHTMMKFPTPRGITTLVTRTAAVFECQRLEEKRTTQEEKAEENKPYWMEDLVVEEVLVNPAFLEQKVTIETQFSKECRLRLINLLNNNMDMFAWQPSDMTRVPKRIIRHTLNVNMSTPHMAQKRRVLGMEKSLAVMKEVEEWVKDGIRVNPKMRKAVADMQYPKTLKEMQSLSEKLAALNPFLAKSAEHGKRGGCISRDEKIDNGTPLFDYPGAKRNVVCLSCCISGCGGLLLARTPNQRINAKGSNLIDLQEEAVPAGEQSSPPAPKTAKQLSAKRNQERVKSILLLAIPDEYLLKFYNVPDAKSF
ncbi:hypothetical protein Tco_0090342 [Tanacetum coccineum]